MSRRLFRRLFYVEVQQPFNSFDGYDAGVEVDRLDDILDGGYEYFSRGAPDDIVIVALPGENIGNIADIFTPDCPDLKPDKLMVIELSSGQRVVLTVLHFPQNYIKLLGISRLRGTSYRGGELWLSISGEVVVVGDYIT